MASHRGMIKSKIKKESLPTADELLSYTHDGEGYSTIHLRVGLPRGVVGMGDILALNSIKQLLCWRAK